MEPLLNLRDLLQHEIEDLYSAEEQIIEALPKMVEKATSKELKKALNDHLRVTKEQKRRLNKVKQLLEKDHQPSEPKKGLLQRLFGAETKCRGTEDLIKEGEKMMGEEMDPAVMDAAIIAAAQKIEHYEISGYGTAKAYAQEIGLAQVVQLLEATLQEEYSADDSLTTLALKKVNVAAERRSGMRKDVQKPGVKKAMSGSTSRGTPVKKTAKVAKKAAGRKQVKAKRLVKR